MKAIKVFFAFLCYAVGFGTIIYYFDFFTGFFVPKNINSGNPDSLLSAILIDVGLLVLFGIQHSVMARKSFKRWFESKVPAALTRSFYILMTSVVLGLFIWFWQPIPLVIYDLSGSTGGTLLLALYYLGWAVGLLSTFEIDHLELFGIKQVIQPNAQEGNQLKTPFFYKVVRHPIYVGWLLIHWMTPIFTVGHLLIAAGMTAYIYIALRYEERDLTDYFGQSYTQYKKTTPKLNPLLYPFKRNNAAIKSAKVIGLLAMVLLLAGCFYATKWIVNEMQMMKSDDPLIWKDEIARITQKNYPSSVDPASTLFIGSSSFRFWDSMENDLAPMKVINNGFGGAKISDVAHYKESLIYQYNSKNIVFFLGNNDICGNTNDKTPQELFDGYRELISEVHQKMPDTHCYILSITPTLSRWDVWMQIDEANDLLRHHFDKTQWATFIDLKNSFLTHEQSPKWTNYKWDGTRLSKEGYNIWANELKKTILEKKSVTMEWP
mgnify:CR=1 FL=1